MLKDTVEKKNIQYKTNIWCSGLTKHWCHDRGRFLIKTLSKFGYKSERDHFMGLLQLDCTGLI